MSTPILSPVATLTSLGPLTNVPVISGTVSLDSTRVPYAVASVVVPLASIPDLDDVDPREIIRAELVAGDGANTRDFDLAVIARSIEEGDGTVRFELASDEALLQMWTAIADDFNRAQFGDQPLSLLDTYVISIVAGGSVTDIDNVVMERAAVDASNLIRNPRAWGGVFTDWVPTGGLSQTYRSTGGPNGTDSYVEYQAGVGGSTDASSIYDQEAISITPGKKYVLSVAVRAYGARQIRLQAVQFDDSNNPLYYTDFSDVTPNGVWRRMAIVFTAGDRATRVRPYLTPRFGLAGSEYFNVSEWMLTEWTGGGISTTSTPDNLDVRYFDGGTNGGADADFTYEFSGDPHASISTRTALHGPTPQELTWFVGDTAWEFLAPLNAMYNRRLWCDEDRVWHMKNPDTWAVAGTVVINGMNATQAGESIDLRDNNEFATGVIVRYRWTTIDGVQKEALDIAGVPDQVKQLEVSGPYPGPGLAQNVLDRLVNRGAVLSVTALTDYSVSPGKTAEVTLPGQTMRELFIASVEWDLSEGLMTVGTKEA